LGTYGKIALKNISLRSAFSSALRPQLCSSTGRMFKKFPHQDHFYMTTDELFRFHFIFFVACRHTALQLHLEHTQMVRSNKVARKRLAQRHSRNGPWTEGQTRTHVIK